jgi:hypothetical protein
MPVQASSKDEASAATARNLGLNAKNSKSKQGGLDNENELVVGVGIGGPKEEADGL